MKTRIYIKKYKKQKLLDTNCWLLRIGNKNCFELKIIIKKLLVLVAYFELFPVTSFISHSWLKVIFEVLFICIFYWCFNHTPWSGCLDVVWWVISLPLPGGLCLWWTSHSLGVWCFLWHWCALFPSFRKIFVLGGVGVYPGIGLMWNRSLRYWVPLASSSMVYDRCPSPEANVPLYRAFSSWDFFINMTVWCCSSLGGSPQFCLSFVLSACFTLLLPALMLLVLSNMLSGIEGRSNLTFLWDFSS